MITPLKRDLNKYTFIKIDKNGTPPYDDNSLDCNTTTDKGTYPYPHTHLCDPLVTPNPFTGREKGLQNTTLGHSHRLCFDSQPGYKKLCKITMGLMLFECFYLYKSKRSEKVSSRNP